MTNIFNIKASILKMTIAKLLFMPEYLQEIKKMIYKIKLHFYDSFVMLKVLL